jgi:hypothetical protein
MGTGDHSFPCSTEVKNAWLYTSTPPYYFMAWCLVKHMDNFMFTLPKDATSVMLIEV